MKKTLTYLLLAAFALSLAACKPAEKPAESAPNNQVANPWSDHDNRADAEKVAGFTFKFADSLCDGSYTAKSFRAMEGMMDVAYEGDSKIEIRQGQKTTDDITGSNLIYSHDFTVDDCGLKDIRCQGSKDELHICSFSDDDASYVIYANGSPYHVVFAMIGELTGTAPSVYTTPEEPDEEPMEGAPVIDEGRLIDTDAVPVLDIAGSYKGANGSCDLNIYTSDDNGNKVGVAEFRNAKGKTVYSGEIIQVTDNWYELINADVNFTIYTENGSLHFDLYEKGSHTDYYEMTTHFES